MKKLSILTLILILPMLFACGKSGDDDMNKGFSMTAKVTAVNEKIEVEVIESEFVSGPFWVITSDKTDFIDKNGKNIKKDDISVGDTLIITYNGQMMMSYPPQVAALKIKKA